MIDHHVIPLFAAVLILAALLLGSCGKSRLWTDVDSAEELRRVFDSDSHYTATSVDRAASETLDGLMDYPDGAFSDSEHSFSPDAAKEVPEQTVLETAAVVTPVFSIEETGGESVGSEPSFDRSLSEETLDEETGENGEETTEKTLLETAAATEKTVSASETYYVLNTNTKKFHRPSCSSAESIKPKNYAEATDRDAVLKDGYEPCKRCDP